MTRSRRVVNSGWFAISSAPSLRALSAAKAASISLSVDALKTSIRTPMVRAADFTSLMNGAEAGRMCEHGEVGNLWHHLVHQPQPFCSKCGAQIGHAGEIAARVVEARNQLGCHWIVVNCEYNWDRGGRCLGSVRRVEGTANDDRNVPAH